MNKMSTKMCAWIEAESKKIMRESIGIMEQVKPKLSLWPEALGKRVTPLPCKPQGKVIKFNRSCP